MATLEKRDLSNNVLHEEVGSNSLSSGSTSEIIFDTATEDQRIYALRDIVNGLSNYQVWSFMGWRDIKQRYRRSTIGPFWVTLSMAFMILGLALVYHLIFHLDLATYLPFVCLGMITWEFISKCIIDGCQTFVAIEGLIKQIRMPLTTHIAATIWRNTIILGHNSIIYVVVLIIFGIRPGWSLLLFIPGFVLVVLNLIWLALLLGTVCARFRDLPLIVQTVVQMLFFVTPVFWLPELLPSRAVLVHGNPFYHMLELLRAPLLGRTPELDSWIFLTTTLLAGGAGTFLAFAKFRRRIAYWL